MSTEDVLAGLLALDEAPWGDIRGKELDSRGLSRRLGKYGVKPRVVRIGDRTPRGYARDDLADSWSRYLPNDVADTEDRDTHSSKGFPTEMVGNETAVGWPPNGSATSATPQQVTLEAEA